MGDGGVAEGDVLAEQPGDPWVEDLQVDPDVVGRATGGGITMHLAGVGAAQVIGAMPPAMAVARLVPT